MLMEAMHWVGSTLTLSGLEIVLGIDNIVFIALLVQHLPREQRELARRMALGMALVMRLAFLGGIAWVLKLTQPFVSAFGFDFSGKDLLLLFGGIFLIYKSVGAMREMFTHDDANEAKANRATFWGVVGQAAIIDLIFSFDSIMAAVGITQEVPIIMTAMVVTVLVMLFAARWVGDFIEQQPTLKTLAISFILLIGVLLVAEGFGHHIPRVIIYSAMAFSGIVETINILYRQKQEKFKAKLKK